MTHHCLCTKYALKIVEFRVFGDVAFFVGQTLAGRHRRHLAEALDADGTVVGRLVELLADAHREISKFAHHVCNHARSIMQIAL